MDFLSRSLVFFRRKDQTCVLHLIIYKANRVKLCNDIELKFLQNFMSMEKSYLTHLQMH